MNGPYFRNYSRSVPVHKKPQQKPVPKVVSIPVHFISSDQPQTNISILKDLSALKIQKVFRGYTVRKSVKKIVSIKNEVNQVENRLNDAKFVKYIRNDAKERLRVNETLMTLLFKLDSIRGFEYGVRDFRKSVTRKVIALQEKIDSISQNDENTQDSVFSDDVSNILCDPVVNEIVEDQAVVEQDVPMEVKNEKTEDFVFVDDVSNDLRNMEADVVEDQGVVEEDVRMEVKKDDGKMDVIEKVMGDNEKIMRLMRQISERNEMETRMINSLSRRVDQLEKVLLNDKMRRIKKKKTNANPALRRREKDCFYI